MEAVYRAAIIGTGRIGSTYDDEIADSRPPSYFTGENRHNGLYTVRPVNHAGAITTVPGFSLVAGANRTEAKLQDFGRRWGVRALYTDFREMLRQEKPDVVAVCTQSPEKAEVTVAAAEAGVRAIVVEKAMATSMAEADAMIAACRRHGVLLAVNHPSRFSLTDRLSKALIDRGEIGNLGTVSTHWAAGVLHGGTHAFDFLRYWAGDVVEVTAHVPGYEPAKDLPAWGTLRFANGVVGFFDLTRGVQPGWEARGSAGFLTLSTLVGDGWLYRIEPCFPEGDRHYPHRLLAEPFEAESHTLSPTQRLYAELHQSLSTGAPFISTGSDGAAALELGLACFASHLAGGPVALPLADRGLRVPNR